MSPNNYPSKKEIVSQELNKQFRQSFRLTFGFDVASAAIIITSSILLLTGHISERTYIAISVGGLGSTHIGKRFRQLYGETNNRLNKTSTEELQNQLDEPKSERKDD